MEIILKQDVNKLGSKDELVKVKAGYGRNFLIPKGLAIVADETNKKILAETVKQRAHKEEKLKTAALANAETLKNIVIKVATKVGEKGKIFGSVTSVQIAEAMKKQGYDVERKNINMNENAIKTTGTYTADVKLHKEVIVKVNFEVVEE
ncbi:MAG: 50S ribosomal protein L9 [Bacteroidetes bacterium]|nr:50S ribosomal protein L9 [Bacteroidota bacterium]